MGFPTLFLAFTVYMAYKNQKISELIGLSLMVPSLIIVYLSYLTEKRDDMDTHSRNVQLWLIMWEQFILSNLMSVDYLTHLIQRNVFFWSVMLLIIIERQKLDENNIYAALGATLSLNVAFETILYINHRAKAKLFMQMKVMTLQE